MIDPTISASLDANGKDISSLRRSAKENSPEALKGALKQFEALFVNMMLKSMRNATPQDGIFDSEQTKMYTSMLDQELSQNFAKRGIGLADAMLRQMTRNGAVVTPDSGAQKADAGGGVSSAPDSATSSASAPFSERQRAVDMLRAYGVFDNAARLSTASSANDLYQPDDSAQGSSSSQKSYVKAFQDRFASAADEASRTTGIPAKFMLGQAALESGWGKKEITAADGTNSHNLFGIKAGNGWAGKVAEVSTTEYVNGKALRKMEKFRAYGSYNEAFQDYARLLSTNPRYKDVMANSQDAAGFAQGLQRAGYATDPNYAAKLTQIINKSFSA